ncbi:MAG TPA: FecR domain-containing protein, partial [Burkholderiaceae bacterium]|nr:FecR domain-containing protein [Burkholderiaceae bacterium]
MSRFGVAIALASCLFCAAAIAQSDTHATTTKSNAQITVDQADPPAGKIDLIGGEVSIIQGGKPARRAVVGDAVNEGDVLVTGKESEAHVTMLDAGFIALRPNTKLKIESYRADGGGSDNGVFSLIIGGMRSITGWIGRYNQQSYKVRTPTATIGVRGTDHETQYIAVGSTEGEPGTYDKVFIGETSIQTDAGQTTVDPDQAGFVSSGGDQLPRVLASVPRFFRPGPHEDIINRKHAEIQKLIEQRRDERRKVVAQKLVALTAARAELVAQRAQNKATGEERKTAVEEQRQDTDAELAELHDKGEA